MRLLAEQRSLAPEILHTIASLLCLRCTVTSDTSGCHHGIEQLLAAAARLAQAVGAACAASSPADTHLCADCRGAARIARTASTAQMACSCGTTRPGTSRPSTPSPPPMRARTGTSTWWTSSTATTALWQPHLHPPRRPAQLGGGFELSPSCLSAGWSMNEGRQDESVMARMACSSVQGGRLWRWGITGFVWD